MLDSLRRRLSYANIVASLALFVALGGTGYAAVTITSKNVKDGTLTGPNLYSGGTFCYEALLLLTEAVGGIASNTPLEPERRLADVWRSERHTVIDLGDDAFTRGRPHPMIDQTLRKERILQEAADPEVAVILFDLVLGYGAHPDPAPELAAALEQASALAAAAGRRLAFVASVCGTARRPGLAGQRDA